MRWVRFVLSLIPTIALLLALSIPMDLAPFPVGDFMNPFQGFWQNAEAQEYQVSESMMLPGMQAEATVVFDERWVPHIFAKNDEDLYFLQGYLTARDRLWQMDFQTRVAAGRLSEIAPVAVQQQALEMDRNFRRLGMVIAAERLEEETLRDPETSMVVQAYTAGVNAYIHSLTPRAYPLEYKLMNYAPEDWSPLKTALLQKYMAYDLSARADDIEHTNALRLWGMDAVNILYPERAYAESPIVPIGTRFRRPSQPVEIQPAGYVPDSLLIPELPLRKPDPNLGSNNWVINGTKSNTGKPILANDPHLGLNLPSIWYEIQLASPNVNVYGVSLPGSPAVIIGFNDSIAWGVTNAGRDVMDYYRIQFKDESKQEYWFNGAWKETEQLIQSYPLAGGEVFTDTLVITDVGPVIFDDNFGESPVPLAVRWIAHEPSNELMTFLKLNRAKNYADYSDAISTFVSPGQNFVFAAKNGDIAIRQQGRFAKLWPGQGRFILDGSRPDHIWNTYIPWSENPFVYNRARGYISSANQHPTYVDYPYYYHGDFEQYRNRRINYLLATTDSISIDDMKKFQQDNYGLMAFEILPVLIASLDTLSLMPRERECLAILRKWDYYYDSFAIAPSLFQVWWDQLYKDIWKDEMSESGVSLDPPGLPATVRILRDSAEFTFYDNAVTPQKENRAMLAQSAFKMAVDSMYRFDPEPNNWKWTRYKNTRIRHLLREPVFSRESLGIGGYKHILNATAQTYGPSWRMVVSLTDETEAYGVYPGGQTGHVGSARYDAFIDTWASGKYYNLWFMKSENDKSRTINATQGYSPL